MAQTKANLAVLFVDVSDSTGLYELLGDSTAFGAVREVIELLKRTTVTAGGRVAKSIGDGLMCVFPSADAAAKAAGEMQWHVAARPPLKSGEQLAIRAGFRVGTAIQDGEDVFGDTVNIAARMAGLALSGQVLMDAGTVAALSPRLRESTRRINAMPVKGKAEPVQVHELLWQMSSDRTVIMGAATAAGVAAPREPRITITCGGKSTVFKSTIYFGREAAGNDVVMTDAKTSRRHAKIELRAGKFVLVDQSSNGTYVVISLANEICLKREELILYANGRFAFGHGTAEPGAEIVEFNCN